MRPTLVAGNWKLNPAQAEARELVSALEVGIDAFSDDGLPEGRVEVALFPPAVYLGRFAAIRGSEPDWRWRWGAQDLTAVTWGAFTGALNAPLLREFGAELALVGHSERRHVFGETDRDCRSKLEHALESSLEPMLCVGETQAERESDETEAVLKRQLDGGLPESLAPGQVIHIAYEPVWAIGTGLTATPEVAQAAHRFVRGTLSERYGAERASQSLILYGGSVKPNNAEAILEQADIDGVLVGGASLDAAAFLEIIETARRLSASSQRA